MRAGKRTNYSSLNADQRKSVSRAITNSARDDYRSYVDGIITDIEAADATVNIRQVTRLTKILSGRSAKPTIMTSKDLSGNPIMSTDQLLSAWNAFLAKKFSSPPADLQRRREHTASPDESITNQELEECLAALKSGKAPGHDGISVEAFKHSPAAKAELFRIVHMIRNTESFPPDLV